MASLDEGENDCYEQNSCYEPTPSKRKRFSSPKSKVEMKKIGQGFVPKNTQKSTDWAVKVYREWVRERNKRTNSDGEVPSDLLEHPVDSTLNYWLAQFVFEVRREDREPYPPHYYF